MKLSPIWHNYYTYGQNNYNYPNYDYPKSNNNSSRVNSFNNVNSSNSLSIDYANQKHSVLVQRKTSERPIKKINSEKKKFSFLQLLKNNLNKIIKTLVILTVLIICIIQTIGLIDNFLSFPTVVNVIVSHPKFKHFPGITVCNNNPILLSKFKRKFPELKVKLENISEYEFLQQIQLKNDILKDYLKYDYFKNLPITELNQLGTNLSDFVYQFYCDANSRPSEDIDEETIKQMDDDKHSFCEKLPVIRSVQSNANCFTFFHSASFDLNKNATSVEWRLIGESGGDDDDDDLSSFGLPLTKTTEVFRFDPDEVVRLKVNFNPEEYTNVETPVSGMILIHDNIKIPSALTNSYYIEPGKYYEFNIRRQTTIMLEPPYDTLCRNYEKNSLNFVKKTGDFSIPLSREQCTSTCIAENCLKSCACWPPEFPYLDGTRLLFNKSMEQCTWRLSINESNPTSGVYNFCYDKFIKHCTISCSPDCRSDTYDVFVQERPWPNDIKILLADETEKESLKKDTKCCAEISIRYWTKEHTIHEYQPKVKIIDLICFIGGLVSMCLGISVINIYDSIVFVLKYFYNKFKS